MSVRPSVPIELEYEVKQILYIGRISLLQRIQGYVRLDDLAKLLVEYLLTIGQFSYHLIIDFLIENLLRRIISPIIIPVKLGVVVSVITFITGEQSLNQIVIVRILLGPIPREQTIHAHFNFNY
jgi:hypothetical protein